MPKPSEGNEINTIKIMVEFVEGDSASMIMQAEKGILHYIVPPEHEIKSFTIIGYRR